MITQSDIEKILKEKNLDPEIAAILTKCINQVARAQAVKKNVNECTYIEQELLYEKNVLLSVLRSLRDGVVVIDQNGKLLLFNPAAGHILGICQTDLAPNEWTRKYNLYLPDKVTPYPMEKLPIVLAINGQAVDDAEIYVEHSKDPPSGIWIRSSGRPLRDEHGTLKGGVVIFRDVTKQKYSDESLQKASEKFIRLFESAPDAIVLIDNKGYILQANKQLEKMFGITEGKLIGKPIELLIPERFREQHVSHRIDYSVEPYTRPMGTNLELYGERKDGTEFPIDVMLSPMETPEGHQIIATIRDVTEQRRKARQLEDILIALTHDLQTPLIAAETSFKLLLENHFGDLTESQKQIINLLTQSNSGALRLVKNLLSVFKYETKSYKLLLEITEISTLLKKATSIVKPMLDEKKIYLRMVESKFQLVCDPFEIERVVVNLLTNALKFTSHGGQVELRAIKDQDGKAIISVSDTGQGIQKEELSSLFERFWHSQKTNSSSSSTGLGLYLSRQIVEAHGGRIWAESKFGKGTKVTFEIPEITN